MIGVSPDSVDAVKHFADKYGLDFTLLADDDHEVADAYGTWGEKSMYGRKYMGVARATFIIDRRRAHRPRLPEGLAEDPRRRRARAPRATYAAPT